MHIGFQNIVNAVAGMVYVQACLTKVVGVSMKAVLVIARQSMEEALVVHDSPYNTAFVQEIEPKEKDPEALPPKQGAFDKLFGAKKGKGKGKGKGNGGEAAASSSASLALVAASAAAAAPPAATAESEAALVLAIVDAAVVVKKETKKPARRMSARDG